MSKESGVARDLLFMCNVEVDGQQVLISHSSFPFIDPLYSSVFISHSYSTIPIILSLFIHPIVSVPSIPRLLPSITQLQQSGREV